MTPACKGRLLAGLLLVTAMATTAQGDTLSPGLERPVDEALAVDTLPADFYTFEPEEYWRTPRESYWLDFSNWVMDQQDTQSERVQWLGEWADRTLSGDPRPAPNNESYLRLGFAAESEYGDPAQFKPEARFRLDVPTVEEKLRLVLESESDELRSIDERRRDRQLTQDQRSDTEATGALRYLSQLGDSINLSNDVGARLRFPPDAFWRARARGRWELGPDWNLSLDQRVYYFHVEGWGERTWVGLDREIGDGWRFLNASEAAWVHKDRNFELAHTYSLYKRLNNRAELNPRIGILGESNPNWRTTDVFADLTYRYRLYSNWLYGEVIPTIEFSRDHSFKDRGSMILRVEMYFAGNLSR